MCFEDFFLLHRLCSVKQSDNNLMMNCKEFSRKRSCYSYSIMQHTPGRTQKIDDKNQSVFKIYEGLSEEIKLLVRLMFFALSWSAQTLLLVKKARN